jgi:diadenosine tetraphosphate (Ap4A) HIT family hydrolase
LVAVIPDAYPVTEGHHLVVPVRHVSDFFEMTDQEVREAYVSLHDLRERLTAADPEIAGFNVGTNSGVAAGQTVFHAHIHLIPRRVGDTPDPRGGRPRRRPGEDVLLKPQRRRIRLSANATVASSPAEKSSGPTALRKAFWSNAQDHRDSPPTTSAPRRAAQMTVRE